MREYRRKAAGFLAGISVAAVLAAASLPGAWAQSDDTQNLSPDAAGWDYVTNGKSTEIRNAIDDKVAKFKSLFSSEPKYDTPSEADIEEQENQARLQADADWQQKLKDMGPGGRKQAISDCMKSGKSQSGCTWKYSTDDERAANYDQQQMQAQRAIKQKISSELIRLEVADESAARRIKDDCTDPRKPDGYCLNDLEDADHVRQRWDALQARWADYNKSKYAPLVRDYLDTRIARFNPASVAAAQSFLTKVPAPAATPASAGTAPAKPASQPQQTEAADIAPPSSTSSQQGASSSQHGASLSQPGASSLQPGATSLQPSDGAVLTRGGDSANMVQATIQQSQAWEAGRGARDAAERARQEALNRYYAERDRQRALQQAEADRQYQAQQQQNNADSAAFFNALGAFANAVGQAQQQRQQQRSAPRRPSSSDSNVCYDRACTMVQ
jgi:hypothetical protein